MSCFILDKAHIDALVGYAKTKRIYAYDASKPEGQEAIHAQDNPEVFGQILSDENYRSFNARYKDQGGAPEYVWSGSRKEYSQVQILKACDGYEYQSCEAPEYDRSLAAQIIHRIRKRVISGLPGYEDADWTINDTKKEAA